MSSSTRLCPTRSTSGRATKTKKRSVISGHTILAMVTTKGDPAWPGDTRLVDHAAAGLRAPSLVRLKLFTLDNRLIVMVAGKLSPGDRKRVAAQLEKILK